jgi:hypothetical protein
MKRTRMRVPESEAFHERVFQNNPFAALRI